jgi:glycosyltransferase involved in cell wall biosynthesis
VTVIIPAYNEERVIEASVHRILASDYPELDVIVADDGSKDRTSAIVAQAFGQEPRVRLMTLTNGARPARSTAPLPLPTGKSSSPSTPIPSSSRRPSASSCAGSRSLKSARWRAMPKSATGSTSSPAGRRSNM